MVRRLNKENCIKCHHKHINSNDYFVWNRFDKNIWDDGYVNCPVKTSYNNCPYELEHLLSGTEEIKDLWDSENYSNLMDKFYEVK